MSCGGSGIVLKLYVQVSGISWDLRRVVLRETYLARLEPGHQGFRMRIAEYCRL